MSNAQHLANSQEHGTPIEVIEMARAIGGGTIGCDPFSSPRWQSHVKAAVWYGKEHDGLRRIWSGFCLVNPPGGITKTDPVTKKRVTIAPSLVRPAWEVCVERWRSGAIDGALWVSFSLEQLCLLQGSPAHPVMFATCLPCERLRYLTLPKGGGPPVPGDQPTHASSLSLLPSRRDRGLAKEQMARFVELGGKLGALVRPL